MVRPDGLLDDLGQRRSRRRSLAASRVGNARALVREKERERETREVCPLPGYTWRVESERLCVFSKRLSTFSSARARGSVQETRASGGAYSSYMQSAVTSCVSPEEGDWSAMDVHMHRVAPPGAGAGEVLADESSCFQDPTFGAHAQSLGSQTECVWVRPLALAAQGLHERAASRNVFLRGKNSWVTERRRALRFTRRFSWERLGNASARPHELGALV